MSIDAKHSRALPVVTPTRRRMVWLLSVGAIGVALLSGGLLILIARPPSGQVTARPDVPPVLATVPAFEATRQDGSHLTQADFVGQVWVANFIFTRCPNICPAFTAKMSGLQALSARRLPSLRLVSFTVDPGYDTPAVLTDYAAKFQADTQRWWFINATPEVLEQTLSRGMLQPLQRGDMQDLNKVMHSSHFALVDRALRVRGFYRFSDASALEEVMHDAEAIVREP